jgi:aspartyl-tRNA(Asn)/glutamyl-tRNA(Gln) amidotransferase subunit C
MTIDAATVRKVARLARIAQPEETVEQLARELSGIMDWIEQLSEVDTDGVEPMTSVVHVPMPMRDDVVTEGGDPEVVLSNAPKRAGAFFVVPKVVE